MTTQTINPFIVSINNNRFVMFGSQDEAQDYAEAMAAGGSLEVSVYSLIRKVN